MELKDLVEHLRVDTSEFGGEGEAESSKLRELPSDLLANVEAEVVPFGDKSSTRYALTWECRVDRGNPLYVNGYPFIARCLEYHVTGISWQRRPFEPGYTTYCPSNTYSPDTLFPAAKDFQIVPVFGGFYWTGCNPSAAYCGNERLPVQFWVNDFANDYANNIGKFYVTVTRYAL